MGIIDTSFAEKHAASNWVTSGAEDVPSKCLYLITLIQVVTIQDTAYVKCSNPVFSTHNNSRNCTNKRCLTKDRHSGHSITKDPYTITVK